MLHDYSLCSDTTSVPPTSFAGPGGPGDNAANLMLPVIGGVTGGIALIIVAIIMLIMVIIFVVRTKDGLKHFHLGSNRRSVNYDHVYDLPINYDRPLPPPVNSIPPRLTMFSNDAYSASSILPYTIGTHETTAVEENKGRVKMQENEAYQPTTDLHLIDNPAYGTDAANAPDISTEANMAYEQTNLIDGHSDSVAVAVQDIITAEESGACATAVYVPEAVEEI